MERGNVVAFSGRNVARLATDGATGRTELQSGKGGPALIAEILRWAQANLSPQECGHLSDMLLHLAGSSSEEDQPEAFDAEYTVRAGETLSGIARSHGLGNNYQSIASASGISNPNKIQAGQKINIPDAPGGGSMRSGSAPLPPSRPASLTSSSASRENFFNSQGVSTGSSGSSSKYPSGPAPTNTSKFLQSQGIHTGGGGETPTTSAVSGPGRLGKPSSSPSSSSSGAGWATKNANAMGSAGSQISTMKAAGDPLTKDREFRRMAGDSRVMASFAARFPHAAKVAGFGDR